MRPTILSDIVTGEAPISYWPICFPVPGNSPRSLCESKLGQVCSLLFSLVANHNTVTISLLQKCESN